WNGKTYKMTGIFPVTVEMYDKPQGHGYVEVEVDRNNPFFPAGTKMRGHEFHYTKINARKNDISTAYKVKRGVGCFDKRDAMIYNNVLAGYTHLHSTGNEFWAKGIIEAASKYKIKKVAR
ncbi:hypothetical protein ACFL7D_12120, partial [candidate division KSB1 bacterium]